MRSRSLSWWSLAASLLAAAVACSVFEPPGADSDAGADAGGGSGGSGGVGAQGGSAGSGGAAGSSMAGSGGVAGLGGMAGASGGGPWWPFTTTDNCMSAGVPGSADRPATGDPATISPFVLAMSRLRFGSAKDDPGFSPDSMAWLGIGFDIDKSCTASPTCMVNGMPVEDRACQNSLLVPFDGANCRDNQIGKLFPVAALSPIVGPLFGITEPNWNCALHRGEFSVLLKVSDYNGLSNDESLRVDMYVSTGLQSLPSWTCTSGPMGTLPADWFNQAPWLHIQPWRVASRSLALNTIDAGTELANAKAADPAAYVRDGYLFANLPNGSEFWLDGQRSHVPGFRLLLNRAVLIGKLAKKLDGTWQITEGTIGGVVLPSEILSAFREIGFCENMCEAYLNVTQYLNTNQDTLSTTSAKLPNTPCDSLSIGIGFEARQAMAGSGDVVNVPPPVDCPPPRHPLAPQHGCVCADGGGACTLPDGGADGSAP